MLQENLEIEQFENATNKPELLIYIISLALTSSKIKNTFRNSCIMTNKKIEQL